MSSMETVTAPTQDLVTRLRKQASQDKIFNAVMHRFAIRERARTQVTLQTLRQTMIKEGFTELKAQELERVLKTLAEMNVGVLKKGRKGRVQALVGIKMRLQSIGKAALGSEDKVEELQERVDYKNIPQFSTSDKNEYAAVLMVNIKGKVVHFPLPPIVGGDLGFLLADLYSGGSAQGTKGRA